MVCPGFNNGKIILLLNNYLNYLAFTGHAVADFVESTVAEQSGVCG